MLKQYIVDAFTDSIFHGNPAAVCILQEWPSDDLMIKIAAENNLSETAFTVKEGARYRLRWFTPSTEIDLCGHATLATAYVLLNYYEQHVPQIVFDTLSGDLTVQRHGDLYEMDFPAYDLHEVPVTDEMEKTLGIRPLEAWMGRDLLCLLPAEDDVRAFVPDAEKTLHLPGLILHTRARMQTTFCAAMPQSSASPKIPYAAPATVIRRPSGRTDCIGVNWRHINAQRAVARYTAVCWATACASPARLRSMRSPNCSFHMCSPLRAHRKATAPLWTRR